MEGIATNQSTYCESEFTDLEKVIVVKPSYMKITEVINETQKHYKNTNIDISLALQQHKAFVQTLKNHQVEVIELPADPSLHEQVFTRDIGFVIGSQLFVSSMSEAVRQDETSALRQWIKENNVPFQDGLPASIEGGDVLLDGSKLWIGETNRTSKQAILEIQQKLPSYSVQSLLLDEGILHLDCVFNIIDEETALLYPPAFTTKGLESIAAHYDTIEVNDKEQFQMGPNVLPLGDGKIISLPQNERLNKAMETKGFTVIRVEFSEIIKSGGSFRCCTLPLKRSGQ
ncbi:N-Dimethylarginine dimethylaminohydrolase [Halobacillus dabanensis]|uniref:N-Dimethylarginine dimethylaminohydrolase n=1 Tax=Halobacillus dabanensis TaxID=240302 RepID=A0A1I3Z3F4_HALDA|nr:arginine deiminase family protein [Halobacillus dabanensis]SFK38567.1 N-Dimethylarginine dimethylaminohydrolase [Halobacillus dabanensis]